jgi:hypothetical protein
MVIMLAALMMAGIIAGGSGNAAAAPIPIPILHVHIDEPTTQQAIVTESDKGAVDFTGAVRVDKLPVAKVTVDLLATVDSGWVCNIAPSTMVITDTADHPFSINVTVPEAAPAADEGHLKVTASASGTGFSVSDEVVANVTVAPYFRVMLESDKPYQEIAPREGTSFKFKVQNPGNAFDSYELEIVNARALKDAGWSVELGTTSVTGVPMYGEKEVLVNVRSPQDWSWDIEISRPTAINLKVTSLGARLGDQIVTQTFLVYAYVRGYNIPLLEMISGLIVVAAVSVTISVIILRRRKKRMRALAKEVPVKEGPAEEEK